MKEEIQRCLVVAIIIKVTITITKETKIKVDGTTKIIKATKDLTTRIKASITTKEDLTTTRIIKTLETKIINSSKVIKIKVSIRARIKAILEAQEASVIKTKTNLAKINNK